MRVRLLGEGGKCSDRRKVVEVWVSAKGRWRPKWEEGGGKWRKKEKMEKGGRVYPFI